VKAAEYLTRHDIAINPFWLSATFGAQKAVIQETHLAGKDAGHIVAGLRIGFDLLQECFPCLKDGQVAGGSGHAIKFFGISLAGKSLSRGGTYLSFRNSAFFLR